ncbi:MAG: DUF4268 domain-containing protein, partial [Candidatus Gracilibacteria bacterium]
RETGMRDFGPYPCGGLFVPAHGMHKTNMYLINKDSNEIKPVEKITFKSAGLKERKNLQEYIAKDPKSLGEGFLIIQKEFSGFDDTNERLDLLALDKNGNLVVIENKLDDTGRDVVWQSLKYVSYCSTLKPREIKDIFQDYLQKQGISETADVVLEEFFGNEDFEEKLNVGNTQRIILVAGEFRKEVTSTVMWLLNFGIKLQCFKVTPYKIEENILLDFDQIIPIKDAEDYIIKVASKNREEQGTQEELQNRYAVRQYFWTQFLKEANKKNNLCANVSSTKENWIPVALGTSGVSINLAVSQKFACASIQINRGSREENKRVFDHFMKHKEQIEKDFGSPLVWERMDELITSRIKWQLDGVNVSDDADYPKMNEFLIDGMVRLKKAFTESVKTL